MRAETPLVRNKVSEELAKISLPSSFFVSSPEDMFIDFRDRKREGERDIHQLPPKHAHTED